jgi:diguanylate cyclase (GGDEF)-like protein/PAS domain S-box-containing protein
VLVWGLFSFRLFDAVPVARDMVLDSLRDGVVVLDSRGCVADLNPAAAEALGWTRHAALNQAAAEAFAAWPALAAACTGQAPPPAELVLAGPDGERCFELRLSVLADPYGRPVGQLVMLHDMTDRKRVEDELRQLAVTDALTGLPNRRRFFEALAEEVRRARRYQTPLALLLLDVDDFKLLNDTYGHQAGDAALAALAQVLRQSSRASDVPTRQGGDEFALLLPHTGRIGAEVAARRLLEAVRAVTDPGGRPLSLSIGGAELDLEAAVGAQGESQAEAMLARADRALYAAKQAGRGGVVVAETPEWRLEAGG